MKKVFFTFVLIIMFAGFTFAADGQDIEKEKVAVKQAALDYLEGWFEGNAERMDRALHEELGKRNFSNGKLTHLTKKQMVEYTQKGGGKRVPVEKRGINVTILDIYRNAASVKTECLLFVDYLHLIKVEDQWKIINVLWENIVKERSVAKIDPKIYKDYLGQYELKPGFILEITTEDNKIFGQATGQPKFEIFPESKVKFFLKVTDAQITFMKDENGKFTQLILHQGGQDIPAKKIK